VFPPASGTSTRQSCLPAPSADTDASLDLVGAKWTDLVDPSREELLGAVGTALDPDAVEMLVEAPGDGRDARPMVESHGAYIAAVLAYPHPHPHDDRVPSLALDLVAGPGHVLTVRKTGRHGDLAPVDAVTARYAEGELEAGEFVHAIFDDVADAFLELLDRLYEEIDELEGHVEELAGAAVRKRLVELRHELLHARRTVSATRAAVRRIVDGRVETGGMPLFPSSVEAAFVDTYETLVRATEELDVARDLLASVRDFYQAKITEGQNEVGKKLTVVASLVLVPSLIVGFFGQNFEGVFDRPYWSLGVSSTLIVVTTLAQLAVFRWRRWI
jgi:Mg2+ and Co2+ transporter CorA